LQILPEAPVDAESTNRSDCGCLELKTILDTANLALSDLMEPVYGSETATSFPLVCFLGAFPS